MASSNIYQASNPLECDICCNMYNDDHCPRILPCSHDFCSRCIEGLILTQKKKCPVCRTKFSQNLAKDFLINRGLLDAAKLLSSMQGGSRPSTSTSKKPKLDFTKDFQEHLIRKGITVCQETEAEVKARIESNQEIREGLQRFIQTLEGMKLSSEKTLRDIDQDNKELMNKLDIMQQEQLNMKESERKLESATNPTSCGATMGDAGQILLGVQKTVSEIKQLLQENDRRRDDMRQDALRIKTNLTDAMKDLGRITEELEGGGDSAIKITVHDFHSFCGCLRKDAEREIFAVMTFEGNLRVAPVKIESNNQVSFTHLEEAWLPPRCFVIELESLIPGGGCNSPYPPLSSPLPRGFLDLAYGPSTHLGRVVIRVTVNGLKGLNFLHMCAGGMGGPSYAHSRVSHVWVGVGQWIQMGAYMPHGGGGGGGTSSTRAVLPSTREEDWRRESQNGTYEETPWKAGDVRGDISYEGASEFLIVTRDDPKRRGRDCFGMVEEGLEVLKAAISKYKDIEQVEVANCGLFIL